ncbi:MAG: hypothetical protein Q7S55_05540 [Nanoarchaeota archaeon]|nr:hypothetical protein [Nanoarchaeota archaeon]
MRHLNNIREALHEVYSERKYFLFSGLFSLLVFSLNALIGNFKLIASQFSLVLMVDLLVSAHGTMSAVSFVSLIIISLLSGIVFSLSIFLFKRQISYSAGVGVTGIVSSILAPACSSCALGLAGILGIGGFLSVLPFKGQELSVLGIILLGVSLVYLSGKISVKVCDTKK